MSLFAGGPLDDSAKKPGETLWQFLNRSSWGRSARARANLDSYASDLAEDERSDVLARLQADDRRLADSTITELWALDYFISAGCGCGSVEFGPETESGGTIDLRLERGNVNIEVHRVSSNDGEFVADRRRETVLATLGRLRSPRFWLHVSMELGTAAPPIRKHLGSIERWLGGLDWATELASANASPVRYEGRTKR